MSAERAYAASGATYLKLILAPQSGEKNRGDEKSTTSGSSLPIDQVRVGAQVLNHAPLACSYTVH